MHGKETFKFGENKGQWANNIRYAADIPSGKLFLENTSIVFVFNDEEDMRRIHKMGHGEVQDVKPEDFIVDGHCFKMNFKGANLSPSISGEEETIDYLNYFLGDDPEKWASDVKQFKRIHYDNIYQGIHYRLYSQEEQMKYDFIVSPGADPAQIMLEYEGLEQLKMRYQELHLKTSVNELIEQKPYAYQLVNGVEKEVLCKFKLEGNMVRFIFPDGYDQSKELVIDPVVVFSSYSGSSKDNWGYTATYDNNGSLYGGGIVFEQFSGNSSGNYPLVGAFQSNYNGGQIDMGISKFSSDGSTLLFSTYIGGNGCDAPHSLVVNSLNQLIILGSSGSSNYPTTLNAFDRTFNGGTSVGLGPSGFIRYLNGSDIVVTRMNASGNNIAASTFVGGPNNDGLNLSSALIRNYGDESRGEIFVDNNFGIYVSSSTQSNVGFPTVGAVQSTYGGGTQDGCVFKLDSGMTGLQWSTYLGGLGDDACYSVQIDGAGNTLIAGGTNSNNFSTTANALHQGPRGGVDGFITKINSLGNVILASTYVGTSGYDQNYFVQFDGDDNVFVVGQTEGNYPVFPPTVYSEPNGGQYIHKLTPGLDTTVFSMRFGSNRIGQVDISLSAFLVNDCDHIYVSGWGGTVNQLVMPGSSTSNMTTTTGAHKTSTDGSDFYLIALAEDADSIIYATYFGATNLAEHVDGGTSRFDKKGIVYQAVCAGCGSSNAFPTTSGSWSQVNGSNNCNLGVIKFDLSKPFSDIRLTSPPYVCVPGLVFFGNDSRGTDFFWDFGDGNTSTDFEPSHMYTDTGNFRVMLVVSDSALCVTTDTSYVNIRGVPPPNAEIETIQPICEGSSVQLFSSGGISRKWYPADGLSNDTIENPIASPDSTTLYTLIIVDTCSSDTAEVLVEVFEDNTNISPDTAICLGTEIQLVASGGTNYSWFPSSSLSDPNASKPIANPTTTTSYAVEIIDQNNCVWRDTMLVEVDPDVPQAIVNNDTVICSGDVAQLNASGGDTFLWEPSFGLDNNQISDPKASPVEGITYTVYVGNACGIVSDKVRVEVDKIILLSVGDSIACVGKPARLNMVGADFFEWEPAELLDRNDIPNPRATITEPTLFSIHGTNSLGCEFDTTLLLGLRPPPPLEAGPDIALEWGGSVTLKPEGNGEFFWEPPFGLSCDKCKNPLANPQESIRYYLTLTDEFGCSTNDSINVFVTGAIFVPNTFTPNNDGHNDFFKVITNDLKQFELFIFNRWGELVYYTESTRSSWDGKVNGQNAPMDSYVWKIKFIEFSGNEGEKKGIVNLIR